MGVPIGLLVQVVLAVLELAPKVIDAVEASTTLTEDERKLYLVKLRARIDSAVERVKAIKFRDV